MENLYEELYKKVNERNKILTDKKLTICPAIKGEGYEEGGIMFVGRAINSWCSLEESVGNGGIKNRIIACQECTLDWVVGENNWKYCIAKNCPYALKENRLDGRKSTTSFWQMVKFICEKKGLGSKWYKKIIWSNLYKASYEFGGNPINFYNEQVGVCNEILIKEIEKFKPKEIYFITERNENCLELEKRTWFCKEYKGKYYDKNTHFGKVYDELAKKDIKVFVLMRPEFKNLEKVYKTKRDVVGNKVEL